MIIAGQLLAIANDLYLRQSDPSDVVLLGVLIVLAVFMLRGTSWARWTAVVLVALGGVLELAGFVLLVVTKADPMFWSAAVPVLASLHTAVVAFTASRAFPLLAGSVLVSALLDLAGAWMLVFVSSVRSFFSRGTSARSA